MATTLREDIIARIATKYAFSSGGGTDAHLGEIAQTYFAVAMPSPEDESEYPAFIARATAHVTQVIDHALAHLIEENEEETALDFAPDLDISFSNIAVLSEAMLRLGEVEGEGEDINLLAAGWGADDGFDSFVRDHEDEVREFSAQVVTTVIAALEAEHY